MIKEYIYIENLTSFQKKEIDNFSKDPKIQYDKILNCELCQSNKIKILFKNDRHLINHKTCVCDDCGFIFSNPRMKDGSAQYFYNSDLYRLLYNVGVDKKTLFKNTIKELKNHKTIIGKKPNFKHYYPNLYFDFINNEITNYRSVLDIGCGKGKKIIDFNFIGKKAYGIEPSKTYYKVHNKLGLNIKEGFIKDIKKKYDLVLLTHVLEHLTDLKKNINHLANITKKYLFIEVPGHVKKLQSIQNAHNYYFSLNTLNFFILNNKFKLIKIDYAKDNEFILALYEKNNKKLNFTYNRSQEKKIIRIIYLKYALKYIVIKVLRLLNIEKTARNFINKLKS
jgi:SAM-dependent methyltransferase